MIEPAGISLDNLTVTYDRHPAIHHVTGRFDPGSLTAIVGPNGAGKSTLLKALAGLLPPADGWLDFVGASARRIAYLPQLAEIERDFPISVFDTVLLGHWRRIGWSGRVSDAMIEEAEQAIRTVGLTGFEDRLIGTLSTGQFQRALFARLIVQDASLVLLDEPFSALDMRTTGDLLAMVHRWHNEGRTVITVLHDFEQVRDHFPETLLLARSCIGWGATETVMTPENLLKAREMAEAWDETGHDCAASGRAA